MPILAKVEPWMLLLAGVVVLTVVSLRIWHRHFGRRRRPGATDPPIAAVPRPENKWSGVYHDAAAEANRREIELHEFAREVIGRVDSKIVVLRQLMAQSDERIAELSRLLRELEGFDGK